MAATQQPTSLSPGNSYPALSLTDPKNNVQFTMPSFEPHFYTVIARRRLMNLYQRLHAAVHAKKTHS